MKIIQLVQGSPEWHAHRANHWNASDAPAMLGLSPYKSRGALLRETATGVSPEISADTQRLFDDGHRYEALARPLAEAIIGDELYPCTGVLENTKLSASFDGLTMLGDTAFEHKSLNDRLRAAMANPHGEATGADLPEDYQVQMEQQCLVSGATRVLFMASKWNGDQLVEERHCWYTPNPELRARLVAGWEQFERDLAAYQAEPAPAPTAVGRAPQSLPALRIEVTGMVTASNLAEFRDHAIAVFRGINTDLQTDQDFADAEQTVKWCEDIEGRLKAAKDHALSQTESIDALFRAIDAISAEARAKRLELDKLVKHRKEAIREDIVLAAKRAYADHVEAMVADTGGPWVQLPAPDFGGAIKGKRSFAAMREAVDALLANAKIAASENARKIRAALAALDQEAKGYEHLFHDRVAFAGKSVEDVQVIARARITEHKQREATRLEQERERIRREEAARLEREQAQRQAAEQAAASNTTQRAVEVEQASRPADGGERGSTGELRAAGEPGMVIAKPPAISHRIKLGDINEAIAPLSVTAEGLAQLGFQPVGKAGAAKLYAGEDFGRMKRAMVDRIHGAAITSAREAA